MTSVVRELEWPASRAISSTGTAEADSRLAEAGSQLPRCPVLADAGGPADGPEVAREVSRVQLGADRGREDQVVVLPQLPCSQFLHVLPDAMVAQRLPDCLGQSEGPAGLGGLGVTAVTHGPPHRDAPAVQVHVIQAERPGFLGADAGHQAQDHVGTGPGGLGGLQNGGGLLGGQRLAGPAGPAFRGIHKSGDIVDDVTIGLGMAERPWPRPGRSILRCARDAYAVACILPMSAALVNSVLCRSCRGLVQRLCAALIAANALRTGSRTSSYGPSSSRQALLIDAG
jgi:hypothetical protein